MPFNNASGMSIGDYLTQTKERSGEMEIEISYLKKENEGLKQSVVFYKQKLSGAQFKLHKQSQWLRDLNLIKDELVSIKQSTSKQLNLTPIHGRTIEEEGAWNDEPEL